MRRFMLGLMVAGSAVMVLPPAQVEAQVSAGVVLDRDGLRHFHMAIGHVYGVPVQSVTRWHPSWIHADELPVVYLLAREARVSPELIIALREQGWSWMDITYHLRVDPMIYVSHLPGSWGPPGHAYGYWRKPSRHDLRRLNDRRIIDYVNVYFWAHAHRRPVTEIIVIRERVPTWTHYVRAEAPRVRFQEPARAQPVYTQPAPATRPAQPRATTQAPAAAPSRSAAPSAGRAPAPAAGRAPAAASNPAANRAPAPAASRAPNPAANRAPTPAASRAPNPAANRAPTPAASRAPNPAANRAPTPAASRAPAAAASRAPAPAANRAPAPAANRAPAPAANRAPAPAASRAPAPAANRAPAPAASRAPAPAANRAPAPAANRAPTPAAARPAAQRGGGPTPPPRPAGRGN